MGGDPRVQHLLEEILDSERSPEEVCRDCAELLPQVRERLKRLRVIEAEVEQLFPETTSSGSGRPSIQPPAELPRIPNFDVQALLGHGGMGVVYKAWDLRLKRHVAIKMLLAGAYASQKERERFSREAEAAAGLRHPNIVQVHELGNHDGRPYFTLEFVEGGTLAQQLVGTPLPVRQAAMLLATLAGAVEVAHVGGIIHRDLKPANVLLTADGIPKITDFGLARRLEGGAALTLSGASVGTPNYMAPEQAQGKTSAVGPAIDIYALGAILYELLTGRPPFLAETASEMVFQLVYKEPVPPSRLNAKVPRDIETICLKCLEKDPARRYATAGELAADLGRFLDDEPVRARPVGAVERSLRWARRHPGQALLLAASVMLAITLAGGNLWLVRQRAQEAERVVAQALREVSRLQEQYSWTEAGTLLERAKDRLGPGAPADLRERLDQARRDLELTSRLDAIRLKRVTGVEARLNVVAERRFSQARADAEYAEEFRKAGLGESELNLERVATRVKASALREELKAALDDWAVCTADKGRQSWLLGVARRAAPDAWSDRVRDPVTWGDPVALAELARTAVVEQQPAQLLVALGERLQATGGDAIGFLGRVQQAYSADFWANFTLGKALQEKGQHEEGVGYYRKALAIRPEAVAAYINIGNARYARYRLEQADGAMENYRQALRIDPRSAPAFNNLGLAWKAKGRLDDAITSYREAVRIDPELTEAHCNLGEVLALHGDLNQAINHYRQAVRIDPNFAMAHYLLGMALLAKGRLDEANEDYQRALRIDPKNVPAHDRNHGLAQDDALIHYDQIFQFDSTWAPAYKDLGSHPQDNSRLDEVIDQYKEALRSDPEFALAHGALAQALLAQGRFGEAFTKTRRCLDLLPKNDYRLANLTEQLKRCERLLALEGRLPAVLQGKDRPADAAECFLFAEICRSKRRFASASGFFADSLEAQPRLADNMKACFRYNAPISAIMAGCGLGEDGPTLSEAKRAHWRQQARKWVQADLVAWARYLDSTLGPDRTLILGILTHWRADPDLAGLRDPAALDRMPEAERQECRRLLSELDALLYRLKDLK